MTEPARRTIWLRLVLAGAALGVATVVLVIADLALHALRGRPVVFSEWLLQMPQLFDDTVIFANPTYRTHEHYAVDKRPLIVTLGDSFTAGYPVAYEHAYPRLLEELMTERGVDAGLIHLAIGDGGPDQQLRLFELQLLPRVTPDVVVWQFFPNDEYDNVEKAVYAIGSDGLEPLDVSRNWLYRRNLFQERIPASDWLRQNSYLYRHLLKIFERGRQVEVPRTYRSRPRAWGLEKIRLGVERMRSLAAEQGFRAYFMLIAPQSLYLTGEARDLPRNEGFVQTYRRMFDVLATAPGFIDARFYQDDGVTLQRDLFADDGRDPLDEGGRHFNERGYRRLADLVAARLLSDSELEPADHPTDGSAMVETIDRRADRTSASG